MKFIVFDNHIFNLNEFTHFQKEQRTHKNKVIYLFDFGEYRHRVLSTDEFFDRFVFFLMDNETCFEAEKEAKVLLPLEINDAEVDKAFSQFS